MKNRFNLKLIVMLWVGFLTSSFHCQVMAQDKPVNSLNNSVFKSFAIPKETLTSS